MKHKEFHRGLIFNHFPELMFYKTGFFKSYGHLMLQVDRSTKNDKGITSDKKFFRDLRENKLTLNELVDYLFVDDYEKYKDEIVNDSLLTEDSETIGGWHVLASLVSGFKLTVKHRDIFNYLSFLEALCLVDKQFIVQQQETARSTAVDPLNDAIKLWLEIDDLDITRTTDQSGEKYLIALVLHWAALYEKFLFVHVRALTSDDRRYFDSLLLDCLPTIDSNGKLKKSISVLLEFRKNNWGESHYKKPKITWSKFHSDIARARSEQKLAITKFKDETPDLEKPNQQIKKKLDRWRNGYLKKGTRTLSFISIDDFQQYIDILEKPYDPDYYDAASVHLLFVNVFELVQFELQKSNISDQLIVDEFSNYPKYQKLVNKRYDHFFANGVLKP